MERAADRYPLKMRETLIKLARRANFSWTGRFGYIDFFDDILDLKSLPSNDDRFGNALDDMWQHTINNHDWDEIDIIGDSRFDPLLMNDLAFSEFLEKSLSVDARSEEDLERFGNIIKPVVMAFGFTLVRRIEFGIFEGLGLRFGSPAVTNQGRAHSQNPAGLEHAGLLFRSQPEIQLFDILVERGFLIAPLPVFIQKTAARFVRCEPDFIVVRYGIWAVVEVDGEAWHHETPQQAHARLQGFEDQGARVIRVPANIASGPDWARRTVEYISERFENFKLVR